MRTFALEMKAKRNYNQKDLDVLKSRHTMIRIGLMVATVIGIFILFGVKSCETERENEMQQPERAMQDSIRRVNEAQRQSEWERQEAERQRWRDSVVAVTPSAPEVVEPPKPEPPKYTWSRLETMVRGLSNEGYYASVWKVDDGSSAWMVLYEKSGRKYIRKFNPETDKYGPKTRLKLYETGKYHVYGDKSRWYKYDRSDLVYEVNGVEKARYVNHRTIDLFTPEPVPDGYEDWEDYYYDNEEDLYFYYNGR